MTRRLSLEVVAQRLMAKGIRVRLVDMPNGSRVLENLTGEQILTSIGPDAENPWDRLLDGNVRN